MQIPKGGNSVANKLARVALGMDESVLPREVEKRVIKVPSIEEKVNGVELKEPN